jgi:hypothetical protein
MATVRVRAAVAIPGLSYGQIGELEREPWVEGAIEDGRLVEVDEDGEARETVLRGEALTKALKSADLSTSGTADEKRARLAEHRTRQRLEAAGLGDAGGAEGPGTAPTGGPAPSGIAPGTQTGGGPAGTAGGARTTGGAGTGTAGTVTGTTGTP